MFREYPTICIVDDEPSVCKALRRLIMSAGFNVITYGSGQAFWDEAPMREPDLLVLDVQMPTMTGLDLQKHLIASGRAIPILFISANGTAKAKSTAMAAGAVAFFQKPVDEKDLLGAIHKSIDPLKKITKI
ncbi:MAG: two-component system response regulator FixJ [Desulforhopalus sp.]|jgi:two-component system response regulator FixJ